MNRDREKMRKGRRNVAGKLCREMLDNNGRIKRRTGGYFNQVNLYNTENK